MARKKKGETVETLTEAPGKVFMETTPDVVEAPETISKPPRAKRLTADFSTRIIKMTVVDGEQGEMQFDVNELSPEIQEKAFIFGVYKKLGTQGAMSAKVGVAAETAVIAQFNALKKGEWKVRATGGAKKSVTLKSVADKLGNLSEEDQKAAIEQLRKIGIELPQVAPAA